MTSIRTTLMQILVGVFLACGSYVTAVDANEIKLGHAYFEHSPIARLAMEFSACIEDTSGSTVRVHGAERFRHSGDLAHSLLRGQFDLALLPLNEYGPAWEKISKFAHQAYQLTPEQAVEYSNDVDALGELNDAVENSGFQLLGIGWNYGTLVSSDSIESLDDIEGTRISGWGWNSREVVESLGGHVVDIPYHDAIAAISEGYVEAAMVDEYFIRHEIESSTWNEPKYKVIHYSKDFAPTVYPVTIVASTSSYGFGEGRLTEQIAEECRQVVSLYNDKSLSLWNDLPDWADSVGISVVPITDAAKGAWTDAMGSR